MTEPEARSIAQQLAAALAEQLVPAAGFPGLTTGQSWDVDPEQVGETGCLVEGPLLDEPLPVAPGQRHDPDAPVQQRKGVYGIACWATTRERADTLAAAVCQKVCGFVTPASPFTRLAHRIAMGGIKRWTEPSGHACAALNLLYDFQQNATDPTRWY